MRRIRVRTVLYSYLICVAVILIPTHFFVCLSIRNFLTLFLSIEVSKAMMEVSEAKAAGDDARCAYAQAMVDCFTDQLNESNPILTEISDAMTEEGHCRDKMEIAVSEEDVQFWKAKMEEAAVAKQVGNEKLMECSSKYKELMKAIRESRI